MPPAARGSFEKPPLDPTKLSIIKSFWKSRNLFSKRFLVAEGLLISKQGAGKELKREIFLQNFYLLI